MNDLQTILQKANELISIGDYPQTFVTLRQGLISYPKCYELYVILGEYYLPRNLNQAYLCFENALFYCDNIEDAEYIQNLMQTLKKQQNCCVHSVSVIILSDNLLKCTQVCVNHIRSTTPTNSREIIVVDNNSTDGSLEWLKEQNDIILYENNENLCLGELYNYGIKLASEENDILFLRNNICLTTNALFWLRIGLYENDSVGSTGAISNHVPNLQSITLPSYSYNDSMDFATKNNVPQKYPYEEKIYLVRFAMLVKRSVYNLVGEPETQFIFTTYEDNDYGLRILEAGYKNILCHNSFVMHFNINTTTNTKFQNLSGVNEKAFKSKWHFSPTYYFGARADCLSYVKEDKEATFRLLDIGCGAGASMAYVKGLYPNAQTYGLELVPEVVRFGKHFGDILCADVETAEFPWPEEYFDYVLMGDILEHLREPALVLKKLYPHIKKGGHIIVSMPNVKHFSVMIPLIQENVFPYADAGILDRTHLKMYTSLEIARLITECEFKVEEYAHTVAFQPTEEENKLIDILVELSNSKNREEYLAFQWIMYAKK